MKITDKPYTGDSLGVGEPGGVSLKEIGVRIGVAGMTGLVTGLAIHYTAKPKTYIMDEKTAREIADTVNKMK